MDLAFLLLLPVTSIIAWIFAFVAAGRYQSIYDKVLIALLLCGGFSIYTVDRHLKCSPDDILYAVFDNIQSLSALSIFPLLFIYIRSITIGKQWEKWYLWLFAPAAVLCLAGTVSSILFGWDAVPVLRIDVFNITLESMSCILLGYCIYYILSIVR